MEWKGQIPLGCNIESEIPHGEALLPLSTQLHGILKNRPASSISTIYGSLFPVPALCHAHISASSRDRAKHTPILPPTLLLLPLPDILHPHVIPPATPLPPRVVRTSQARCAFRSSRTPHSSSMHPSRSRITGPHTPHFHLPIRPSLHIINRQPRTAFPPPRR